MRAVKPQAPRRERLRAATIAEIKQAAREQVAAGGVSAISLRGVARAMGMTPSALYRYFDSHDVLVDELVADAFASLAEALEAAYAAAADDPQPARRWLRLARSYRRWAREHQTEYTLLFGPRLAFDTSSRCAEEMLRAVGVLFRCMINEIAAGNIDPSHLDSTLTPALREKLLIWGDEKVSAPLSAASLAGCMTVWVQLHGFLSLELFGQLPDALRDFDDLFDRQMLDVLVRIGYRWPIDWVAVTADPPAPGA
jgi:AcrR family transcriptional regulator